MKIALLHHWLVSMRGGEKVLEQFCRLMPGAEIHTLVRSREEGALSETVRRHPIRATLLDRLPGSETYYPSLLPLYPWVIGRHRVAADFILSSDASMIKGMTHGPGVPHVCYCHSPPRYLWDMQADYMEGLSGWKRRLFRALTPRLRRFDRESAGTVDHFIANSRFVRERIRRIYGRDSKVIYPPVDLDLFRSGESGGGRRHEDYYLVVSALVPYKKVELAVRAFTALEKPLLVCGEGSQRGRLERIAGPSVRFLGAQSPQELKQRYRKCRAFVFPGVEDFGITPLEAQAAGRPVIAYGEGGALETVSEGETGLFFREQTPEALAEAVARFERTEERYRPEACRARAERFGPERFRREIKDFLLSRYPSYFKGFW